MAASVSSPPVHPAHAAATRLVLPSAPRDDHRFSFTPFLRKNFSFGLARDVPVCNAYREGHCPLGPLCPDRHPTPSRLATATSPAVTSSSTHGQLVCKHYLKGLCKKGLKCEYLHEYNLRRMPECQSFARSQYCPNGDECLYQHVPFDERIVPCEHYERGFCPLGPHCAKNHVRRELCLFYLAGFCPDGPKCSKAHPRFPPDEQLEKPRRKDDKTDEEREAELAKIREEQEKEKEREREWRAQNRRGGGFVKRYGPKRY